MTDIQWICIWSDVGYQPGGHHVPYPRSMPIGLELWQVGSSDPDIVIDPVLRTTLAQITTMDLPVEYKDIRTATYIAVLISGTSDFIYGWIRSIEEIAGRSPACRIEWEVDNWRTYFGMELRRGCTLLRYPVSGSGLAMNTDIVNIRQGEYRTAEVLGSLTDYLNVNSTYIPTALKDAWLHLNWAVIRYVTPGSRTKITTVTWPV